MSNAPRPPAAVPATSYQQQRQRLYKYKLILGGAVLAIAVVAVMGSKLFSISVPNGTPLGLSASASNNVVTLIQTLEAYTPSLHRNHANDRYTVSLFVYQADGASKGRMIRIGKGFRASELNLMKVLGFDGATVWCLVNRIEGVNLQTGKLVDAEKLRKANPSIDETWDDPRPRTPDRVPEPILVTLDPRTGEVVTTTLWQ